MHVCCRTAQKHCCVSYLKEKSCVAGAMGAKEGEDCGLEDSDTCGVSLYKASSTAALWPGPEHPEGLGWGSPAGLFRAVTLSPGPGGLFICTGNIFSYYVASSRNVF